MRKVIALAGVVFLIYGCSSVEMIEGAGVSAVSGSCNVRVYQTRRQAEKLGEIEELCIITGTSSMSFVHSVAVAIDKHKSKACACGAADVYIESRQHSGLDVASVTMVAFRVVKPADRSPRKSPGQ